MNKIFYNFPLLSSNSSKNYLHYKIMKSEIGVIKNCIFVI